MRASKVGKILFAYGAEIVFEIALLLASAILCGVINGNVFGVREKQLALRHFFGQRFIREILVANGAMIVGKNPLLFAGAFRCGCKNYSVVFCADISFFARFRFGAEVALI